LSVYLDQTATTDIDPDVKKKYIELLNSDYANPASLHEPGLQSEKLLTDSRRLISQAIGQRSGQLVLTSGGSESINLAIKGYLEANKRLPQRIITSAGEHAATYETALHYRKKGFKVDFLPLQQQGTVDLDALLEALQQPAALLSLIQVSNETGAENPVSEIVRLRNRCQPDLAIHLDAVQAFGKIPFSFDRLGVDMISGSGHKIGAPKSIGWLCARPKIRLEP
jgi:cysteine desulfurase